MGEEKYTGASGEAEFQLEPGAYKYTVTKEGYGTKTGSFVVTDSAVNVPTIVMPSAEEVTFTVTDDSTADNIEGVSIDIYKDSIIVESKETNANGQAVFHLLDGEYTYKAVHGDYNEASGSITVDGVAVSESFTMTGITPAWAIDDFGSSISTSSAKREWFFGWAYRAMRSDIWIRRVKIKGLYAGSTLIRIYPNYTQSIASIEFLVTMEENAWVERIISPVKISRYAHFAVVFRPVPASVNVGSKYGMHQSRIDQTADTGLYYESPAFVEGDVVRNEQQYGTWTWDNFGKRMYDHVGTLINFSFTEEA